MDEFFRLGLDLLFGAEDVGVVLRHLPHAQEAVQRAVRLVAMAAAELCEPHRQVAVALDALVEDLDVGRAVHRLQGHQIGLAGKDRPLFFGAGHLVGDHEHVLAVLAPMARGFPEFAAHQLRRLHFRVAALVHLAPDILFHLVVDHEAFWVPEDAAGRLVLQMEQVELAADLAMVSLFGLGHHRQIVVEFLLRRERRSIEPRQHRVVAVAAPVGAGHLGQLEGRADILGRAHVRAAAEVEPLALLVDLDHLVGRDGVDQFDLEVLALGRKDALGLVARPHFLGERSAAGDDLGHLLFDRREIVLGEGRVALEVVIKAVLDHRADGDLRRRPKFLHGFGEDVRSVVPDQSEAVGAVAGDEFDAAVLVQRITEIGERAVPLHGDGALGKAGRNPFDHGGPGRARRVIARCTIGKRHLDRHFNLHWGPAAQHKRGDACG